MRLLLRRDNASGPDYKVYYEDGQLVYIVDSRALALAGRIEIRDPSGRKLFAIKRRAGEKSILYRIIDSENDVMATISNQMVIKPDHLRVDSDYGQFIIKGDLVGQDYGFVQEGEEIARMLKPTATAPDTRVLDIYDYETEELLAMAAGGESLEFEDFSDEDDFDAFLLAVAVVVGMLFIAAE